MVGVDPAGAPLSRNSAELLSGGGFRGSGQGSSITPPVAGETIDLQVRVAQGARIWIPALVEDVVLGKGSEEQLGEGRTERFDDTWLCSLAWCDDNNTTWLDISQLPRSVHLERYFGPNWRRRQLFDE